jgi:hypothetical protein
MNRPDRNVILAGLVFSIIWGGLFYYFAQIYPEDWYIMVKFGLGVPLLVMWHVMNTSKIVGDFVESIRNERIRDFLKSLADIPFGRYILIIFILVVLALVLKVISMF